jgi:hypothetical protein
MSCLVELVDGTRLPADDVLVAAGRITLELDDRFRSSSKPLRLPSDHVAAIRLGPLTADAARDWDEIRAMEIPADMLVVRKGTPVRLDHLEGVIGDIDPTHVHFVLEEESVPVKREKVAGVIYLRPSGRQLPSSTCVVHGVSGMELHAASVRLQDNRLQVVARDGLQLEILPEALRWIDFSAGKLVYLSDLSPLSAQWTPLIGMPASAELAQQAGKPRADQSFFGSQLSLSFATDEESSARRRIERYNKGLAVRSRTSLTYSVPDDLARFVAVAGIDPAVRHQGHVRLVVEGDGTTLLDVEIAGTGEPLPIDLSVSRIRRLTLLVDYGDNWDFGDLLNLCDAKFTK